MIDTLHPGDDEVGIVSFGSFDEVFEYRKKVAREFVDTLAPEIQDELGALAQLNRAIHLGTDLFGERVPPNGIDKLMKTEKALRSRLAQRHKVPDNYLDTETLLRTFGFNVPEIKQELINRIEAKNT